jgi:choline transport protein
MASQIPSLPPGHSGDVVEMMAQPQREGPNVNVARTDVDIGSYELRAGFKSTSADAVNMRRMGKDQQLVRHFRVLSMASFVAVATASWEFTVFVRMNCV